MHERVLRLADRFVPIGAHAEERRRSLVVIAFTAIVVVAIVICAAMDASQGAWRAVAVGLGGGSVAVCMLPLLRRGYIRLTAHVHTGLFVFGLFAIASGKGGLMAPEMAWLCAAIVFAVLGLGAREAVVWTLVACAGLFVMAARFDTTGLEQVPPAFREPFAFAVDHTMLYLVTWALAVAFDRARSDYLSRLALRNAEMKRVLEHSKDGLITIDRDGFVGVERSLRAESWLGPMQERAVLWDVVARDDERAAGLLRLGWEAILDDFLPREVSLDQMPKHLTLKGRTLRLEVNVIDGAGGVAGALLVLHDVTDELSRERAERANQDLLEVFKHARVDPQAVVAFVQEMDRLAGSVVTATEAAVVLRDIHTMKGNAGMFGVRTIADLCHHIEQTAADEDGVPSPADREVLAAAWADVSRELSGWVDADRRHPQLDVEPADLEELCRAIAAREPHPALARLVGRWRLAPMSRLLARLARQTDALAARMGKRVRIEIEPTTLRVDGDALAPVLSALSHVIRNAIDHGLEPEEERVAQGKAPVGTLHFAARLGERELELEISDDGRGVDWEAVRRKAGAAGVSRADDPSEILFNDGFSTREAVTAISGRGVGLGAVRAAVRDAGGDASFRSEPGRGSAFSLSLPASYASGRSAPSPRQRLAS